MTQYIGLNGYARSGKDTVAGILSTVGYERFSFASRLKAAVKELDPIIEGQTDLTVGLLWEDDLSDAENWENLKDNYPECRRMLQRMGTEVGRKLFGENFWVEQAFAAIPEQTPLAVFTDCRFPNEADAIRERGGQVWRINRPGFEPVNAHASETSLDHYNFDEIIVNDGSINDLGHEVLRLDWVHVAEWRIRA